MRANSDVGNNNNFKKSILEFTTIFESYFKSAEDLNALSDELPNFVLGTEENKQKCDYLRTEAIDKAVVPILELQKVLLPQILEIKQGIEQEEINIKKITQLIVRLIVSKEFNLFIANLGWLSRPELNQKILIGADQFDNDSEACTAFSQAHGMMVRMYYESLTIMPVQTLTRLKLTMSNIVEHLNKTEGCQTEKTLLKAGIEKISLGVDYINERNGRDPHRLFENKNSYPHYMNKVMVHSSNYPGVVQKQIKMTQQMREFKLKQSINKPGLDPYKDIILAGLRNYSPGYGVGDCRFFADEGEARFSRLLDYLSKSNSLDNLLQNLDQFLDGEKKAGRLKNRVANIVLNLKDCEPQNRELLSFS